MHKALLLLKKIPRGKVTTYGILAKVCKTSPRAVGRIMKTNPYPEDYPCYKVVTSSGKVGNYSGKGGIKRKVHLLRKDGIPVIAGVIDKRNFYRFIK